MEHAIAAADGHVRAQRIRTWNKRTLEHGSVFFICARMMFEDPAGRTFKTNRSIKLRASKHRGRRLADSMCVTRGRLGQLDLADAACSGKSPRRACFHHDPRRFAWYVPEVVATIIDDRDARREHAIRSRCWYGGLYSGGQRSVRRKERRDAIAWL